MLISHRNDSPIKISKFVVFVEILYFIASSMRTRRIESTGRTKTTNAFDEFEDGGDVETTKERGQAYGRRGRWIRMPETNRIHRPFSPSSHRRWVQFR